MSARVATFFCKNSGCDRYWALWSCVWHRRTHVRGARPVEEPFWKFHEEFALRDRPGAGSAGLWFASRKPAWRFPAWFCNWVRSQNHRNQAWICKSSEHHKLLAQVAQIIRSVINRSQKLANWRRTLKWDNEQHIFLHLWCCWLQGICVLIVLSWLTVVICD